MPTVEVRNDEEKRNDIEARNVTSSVAEKSHVTTHYPYCPTERSREVS